MAEMKQDMYGATGRVGNKMYYQRMGKTIARTITKPKNPKTEAQSLHRVLVKAVNNSYSKLKDICNHSFEDYDNGFECMNKFRKVNFKYLREHATALQNLGQGLDGFYQFSSINSEKWTPFAAIISEGHLPEVNVGIDAAGGHRAAGIIVSREDESGNWFRSNCQLMLNEASLGSDLCSLAKAVAYSYKTSEINVESEFYLNNADSGSTPPL